MTFEEIKKEKQTMIKTCCNVILVKYWFQHFQNIEQVRKIKS